MSQKDHPIETHTFDFDPGYLEEPGTRRDPPEHIGLATYEAQRRILLKIPLPAELVAQVLSYQGGQVKVEDVKYGPWHRTGYTYYSGLGKYHRLWLPAINYKPLSRIETLVIDIKSARYNGAGRAQDCCWRIGCTIEDGSPLSPEGLPSKPILISGPPTVTYVLKGDNPILHAFKHSEGRLFLYGACSLLCWPKYIPWVRIRAFISA